MWIVVVVTHNMTVGNTVDEAVHLFVSLERHCKVQLLTEAAAASGIQKTLIDPEDAAYTGTLIQNPHVSYMNVCIQDLSCDCLT